MILGALIGTILGLIAGIFPGLHSNTFSALIVSASAFLFLYFSPEDVSAMIITSAIAYTIANIIPATFLGVPSEDTAVAILPAHKMVLEGRGFEVLSLSCFSSLIAVFVSLPLFFTSLFVGANYEFFVKITPFVLISIAILLIMSEKGEEFEGSLSVWRKRFYALLIFSCSGFLGYISLENSELAEITPAGSVLLPLLTGLFGAPILLFSIFSRTSKIPKQKGNLEFPDLIVALKGSLAGFFVSIFPGISSGVATVVSSLGEKSEKGYIVAMSSANTANAILCFFMLIAIDKTRSGSADALKSLNLIPNFQEIAILSLFSGTIAFLLTLAIGFFIAKKIDMIDGKKLSILVFSFLTAIVIILTGIYGLAVFFSAIPIGLSTQFLGVRRINCMGCLILPVTLWYLS
ncbi:MAG: tripartite tricarboxylate transporter permease [Archaeoglobaceae archaeon]|nr:tripartite tricarboxylate transporter permease [Archaeoglobaceae archaeon]MDW8118845.1 tripartite tricarboxylate transporter permease [Archaeoglobaceae archaeon]